MNVTLEALRPTLVWTLESLGVGFDDRQVGSLLQYLELLKRWNAHYNLTAVRDVGDMLTQHIADCLAVLPPVSRHFSDAPFRMLDVGSGGGFPGVVIAIMLPQVHATCIDSVGKKAAFVQQVASELRLPNLRSQHGRVEELSALRFDLVTSRAFASLIDFTSATDHLLNKGACWMAMKGKVPTDEIATVQSSVEVFHVEHLAVPGLAAERCLVWMRQWQSGD